MVEDVSSNSPIVVGRCSQVPQDSTLLWDTILPMILSTVWSGTILVAQITIWTAQLLWMLTRVAAAIVFQLVMRNKPLHKAPTHPTSSVTISGNTSTLRSGVAPSSRRSALVQDLLKKKKSMSKILVQQEEASFSTERSIATETSTSTSSSSDVASDREDPTKTRKEMTPQDNDGIHDNTHMTLTKRNRRLVVPVTSGSSHHNTTHAMSGTASSSRSLWRHHFKQQRQSQQQQLHCDPEQHPEILRRPIRGSSLLERVASNSARWMPPSSTRIVRSLSMTKAAVSSTRVCRRSSRLSSTCQDLLLQQLDECPEVHPLDTSTSHHTTFAWWNNQAPNTCSTQDDDGRSVPWISTSSSSLGTLRPERQRPSPAGVMEIVVFDHGDTTTTDDVVASRRPRRR